MGGGRCSDEATATSGRRNEGLRRDCWRNGLSEALHNLVAIDLGASNGRVIVGRLREKRLTLEVVHRFEHSPVRSGGLLRWDWAGIAEQVRVGLVKAVDGCDESGITSISCSSWAQDFGLLDGEGRLFYPPVCYRDSRTDGMPMSFGGVIGPDELVKRVGSGVSPVTALCQLRAMVLREPEILKRASGMLFVADLVHWMLCGSRTTDWTMATASQLRNLGSGRWDHELMEGLGIPSHFLPGIVERPAVVGRVPDDNGIHSKLGGVPVISTAGHDTAVAAAAVNPLAKGTFFLSLGTWAMLGCCTDDLLVPASPAANGWFLLGLAGGKWGVFRAGTGLWLMQECRRLWEQRGLSVAYEHLVEKANCTGICSRIDPSDVRFNAPADMLLEITGACRETGQEAPCSPGEFARVIFDSLSQSYADGLRRLEAAAGCTAGCLRVIGGGSRNAYLCQRIRSEAGVSVVTGPAEATAVGNLSLQATVLGLGIDQVAN